MDKSKKIQGNKNRLAGCIVERRSGGGFPSLLPVPVLKGGYREVSQNDGNVGTYISIQPVGVRRGGGEGKGNGQTDRQHP